ncbi:MAG: hypothetical protein E7298_00805 [Lachnospiraceae bacterium]|nr:hypothetical protein [Lachnospiraceae bacterium]
MKFEKVKESRIVLYICAFIIPFVMMMIFWKICGIYPFGEHSILTGDMDVEFVNFYTYFINTFKTKNDWSYMLTKTIGGDYPGLAAFQLHDPLLLLLFFFPGDKIAVGIEFVFSLQISIAGLTASILLNERYERSWLSLLFSTAYAFSSFFFGYLVLTIYFGALAVLPLVLFFFLKFLDDGQSLVGFVISAAYYIFVNYHMGFMLVIFLVILYISRIIADTSYIRRLPSLALAGVTTLLIDGFFLIRTGLSLMGEKTTEGADYGFYRRFPMNQLFAGMFSGCARNDLRPLIYASVAALFFAVVYLLQKRIPIRDKIANVFVIATVAVSMWINSIDAVWHGFNNPEGFYWRYAYYISITVIVMAYKGFISFTGDGEGRSKRPVMLAAVILLAYMGWLTIMHNPYLDRPRLILNVCLVIMTAFLGILVKSVRFRMIGFVLLMGLSIGDMLYNSETAYISLNSEGGDLPLMADFKDDYHNISDVISYVKSQDDGFYRIEKDFDRAINDPSMFDYIGLSHDSSCEKDEILDWLVNFGFCKTVYFTYYNGGSTSFVDNLFGIKYYISQFDSVNKPYESMLYDGKYYAYRNGNALPMAFTAPEGLSDYDINEGNTFEKQNRLASLWNDRPVYIKADPDVLLSGAKEEEGRYVRTDEEGYIIYDITITEKMPLYFYFYAPGRQNGEVFVNGESRDVYFTVNHWNTLCAGVFEPQDKVEIKMQILEDELEITESCFYYEDPDALREWADAAGKLNESVGAVNEITSSDLMFSTDSAKEETIVMSIPYEDSWRITCDGKRIKSAPVIEQLMSFQVPEGRHIIEMKYIPKGTGAGIAVSIIGIILFFGQIVYSRKRA